MIYPPLLFIQRATYLISRAERPLHVMQAVRHGVDGINDKAHLGVLCVLLPEGLSLCGGGGGGWQGGKGKRKDRYNRETLPLPPYDQRLLPFLSFLLISLTPFLHF